MDERQARAIAERVHAGDPDVLRHLRRVVVATPSEGHAVAWLHEAIGDGRISEQELLLAGLSDDELRALRLLSITRRATSDSVYLALVEMIARAAGRSGILARMVKAADLTDRRTHPRMRPGGWTPPYARGLALLAGGAPHPLTAAPRTASRDVP